MIKNRVAEFRTLRGMKQTDLADAAGQTPVQISRLEKGERRLNEENAVTLARALGVQPGDLMPIITDGSVPINNKLSSHELSVMAVSMAKFMEMHTDYDPETCERLGMAAVKMFQMTLAGALAADNFDLQHVKDSLDLD